MLTRIYGLAFLTKKELVDYIQKQTEAEKRDHRLLGQKLDLFHFDEEFGLGLPLWHPKGALLRQIIEDYCVKEYLQNNYQLLRTPHIANLNLWKNRATGIFIAKICIRRWKWKKKITSSNR